MIGFPDELICTGPGDTFRVSLDVGAKARGSDVGNFNLLTLTCQGVITCSVCRRWRKKGWREIEILKCNKNKLLDHKIKVVHTCKYDTELV